ncbi:hypothetical protein ACE1B6_11575 [Aerosakkonemataceae cyanobacterium BLCC-F154]|uniref:LAGLIDADG homing endonuclease n=1 Tax=Floridaenema fluviatile BLCC-F154 TaxID=3153640 RepID=A0ABV4YB09_9CYAN
MPTYFTDSKQSKPIKPSIDTSNPIPQFLDSQLEQIPVRYKGWKISTKVINGKLWLRWQHPHENFPRYGCPVSEEGLEVTINNVKFLINLANKLEEELKIKSLHRR